MKRRLGLTSLALVTALTLAACSDDGDSSEDANEEETTSQETPTEEPTDEVSEEPTEEPTDQASPEPTEPEAPAGDMTEPGSELAIGEAATVSDSDEELVFEISVDKFEKATPAERKQLGGDATDKKYDVYYVHTTGTLVSGQPDGYDPALNIDGLAGESPTANLIKFGAFAPCENNTFEEGAAPGTEVTSCGIVMSQGGKVDAAMYSDTGGDYSVSDGTEVRWR